MGDKTTIEWTSTKNADGSSTPGATWNPIRARRIEIQDDGSGKERIGWHCEHVSPGCVNCYAEAFNTWVGTGRDYKPVHLIHKTAAGDTSGDVSIFLDEKMLLLPLRWKRGRKIFVCSMTDLFADFVTDEMLDRVFAMMYLNPRHIFQCLTKRSARMLRYMTRTNPGERMALTCGLLAGEAEKRGDRASAVALLHAWGDGKAAWPPVNVHLGVSVEDQPSAYERIPDLLATPAAVRFLSIEPLLEDLDLSRFLDLSWHGYHDDWRRNRTPASKRGPQLSWGIVGGESGPKARPFDVSWALSIVRQFRIAEVPVFVKQLGAHVIWNGERKRLGDPKGGDWNEWPESLRVREFPEVAP